VTEAKETKGKYLVDQVRLAVVSPPPPHPPAAATDYCGCYAAATDCCGCPVAAAADCCGCPAAHNPTTFQDRCLLVRVCTVQVDVSV
jgi:hypothetical protein